MPKRAISSRVMKRSSHLGAELSRRDIDKSAELIPISGSLTAPACRWIVRLLVSDHCPA